MKKLPALLLAPLALLFAGCPDPAQKNKPGAASAKSAAPETKVVRRDIEEAVEAAGVVESVNAPFDVRPEISGRIVRIAVETGQTVKRGDTLVELDDTALRAELDEADRNEQLARLDLDRAKRDKLRQESLFKEGFATGKAVTDAKTDSEYAGIKLQLAEARLTKAKGNLAKTIVTAPFDGFVSDIGVTVEQLVSGNGTLLLRVYDFSKLRVAAKFNEFDAARLAIGKGGVITFDSLPGVSVPGTIGYISPFASSEQNLRVFTARVDFLPKGATVRPGVSATVRIVTRRSDGALTLPLSCVFVEGASKFVYVKNPDGTFARRTVETGLNDTGFVELRSGVAEGETVALVRPGEKR